MLIYELDLLYIFDVDIVLWDKQIYLIFDLINFKNKYSPRDRDQIGIKLGTDYFIYQKIAHFKYKKGIHLNRLQSDIFGI